MGYVLDGEGYGPDAVVGVAVESGVFGAAARVVF